MEGSAQTETALVADLNDLLKLDHDAVQAYTLAIKGLESEEYKARLVEFRGDHQRHIDELTQLVRSRGGTPMEMSHVSSGVFKLAVQAVGTGARLTGAAGDRAVLVAFKANERQVRDKYRRLAREVHEADVTSVLARAADDEARHYAWVLETLEDLGFDQNSAAGKVERAFEVAHQGMADVMESAERKGMQAAERAKRALQDPKTRKGLGAVLLTAGAAFVAAQLFGRDRR